MNEFLKALAITLTFVLGGYFLFGGIGKTQTETETMEMDMSGMNMSPESSAPSGSADSMSGMSH